MQDLGGISVDWAGEGAPFLRSMAGNSVLSAGAAHPDDRPRWQVDGKWDVADIGTWYRCRSAVHGAVLERRATFVANRITINIRTLLLNHQTAGESAGCLPDSFLLAGRVPS